MAEEMSPESKVYVKEKIKTKRLLPVLLTTAVLLAVAMLSGCLSPDSDGDGVSDQMETEGYLWENGKFRLWDGNPNVAYYLSDPSQWSTDQDAFPDGMEASGALMDVSVQKPGDNPLVPAYPNIVVRLVSYAVTLNDDISYTDGGSMTKGSTWDRETAQTFSRSTEHSWEVGAETTVAWPPEAKVSASYSQTHTNTQTTSTAVSVGNSVLDETNWSRARTSNPTTAAQLKLRLKVHNYGTACVSNIIPTLALRIGGINVATFEPGNAQINMLTPGGQYPVDKGVYWVVDSIDTGVGVTPLYITLDELRALERGVPVSLTVTQLKADVMLKNRSGEWANAGDCSEYLARCEAVGANIHVEIGDGSFVHHLVYADDAPSAPRVTLRDALTNIGVRANWQIDYKDTQGNPQVASIKGCTFVFDQETLRRNDWDMDKQQAMPPDPNFDMADMVLFPGSSVLIRQPLKSLKDGPTIHYANADPRTLVVQACVSDYDEIRKVEFLAKEGTYFTDANDSKPADANDRKVVMRENIPGSGFFSFVIQLPYYAFDGTERVIATNLDDEDANQPVEIIHYEATSQPENPVFNSATLYNQGEKQKVYANITNPNTAFPIDWVKVFIISPPELEGTVIDMHEPPYAYKDPDGYTAELPPGCEEVKVVAYILPNVYKEKDVNAPKGEVMIDNEADLITRFDWTGTDEWGTRGLNVDTGELSSSGWKKYPYKFKGNVELTTWCTAGSIGQWRLNFNVPYAKVKKVDSFESIIKPRILYYLSDKKDPGDCTYTKDDIFVFKTVEGRYAKLQIVTWNDRTNRTNEEHVRALKVHYVVYKESNLSDSN